MSEIEIQHLDALLFAKDPARIFGNFNYLIFL